MYNEKEEKKPKHCIELEDDGKTPHEIALARCECLAYLYYKWKRKHMNRSNAALIIALISTALTPIVLLLPIDDTYAKIIVAILASFATIATGWLAITGSRDNYIRYGYIYHVLQTEKYLYLTGAGETYKEINYGEVPEGDPYYPAYIPDEKATKIFSARVEQLVMADVTDWRDFMSQGTPDNSDPTQ